MSEKTTIPLRDIRNTIDMCIGHLTIKETDAAAIAYILANGFKMELTGVIEVTPTNEYKLKEISFVPIKAEN